MSIWSEHAARMRTAEMFEKPPRARPRVLMHEVDSGSSGNGLIGRFKCRCGYNTIPNGSRSLVPSCAAGSPARCATRNHRKRSMIDCRRCSNTGRIIEFYADFGPVTAPTTDLVQNATVPTKTRWRECPDCLGFSAVPLRPASQL